MSTLSTPFTTGDMIYSSHLGPSSLHSPLNLCLCDSIDSEPYTVTFTVPSQAPSYVLQFWKIALATLLCAQCLPHLWWGYYEHLTVGLSNKCE